MHKYGSLVEEGYEIFPEKIEHINIFYLHTIYR